MADPTAVLVLSSKTNTPTFATSPTVLVANARAGWQIQNQGTNPLFVLLGTGATFTTAHVVLQACTAVQDGKGGLFSQFNGAVYQGIVSATGTGASYTVLEMI